MNIFSQKRTWVRLLVIALAIIASVYALKVLQPKLSSADLYTHEMEQLDIKRTNVMKLVTASSLTSALISAIPEDTATPIANQLAEFSKLFIVILTVLLTEKYLLTIFGSLACYMIVASCVLTIVYNLGYKREWIYNTIIKILILAVACSTFIPASIRVTDMIEETHRASIDRVINEALEKENELKREELEQEQAQAQAQEQEKEGNLWGKVSGVFNSIGDAVTEAVDSASQLVETAKSALGSFVEAIAVMFVTSCVIPILTLLLYFCVFKYLFGLNFNASSIKRRVISISPKRLIWEKNNGQE